MELVGSSKGIKAAASAYSFIKLQASFLTSHNPTALLNKAFVGCAQLNTFSFIN